MSTYMVDSCDTLITLEVFFIRISDYAQIRVVLLETWEYSLEVVSIVPLQLVPKFKESYTPNHKKLDCVCEQLNIALEYAYTTTSGPAFYRTFSLIVF